MSTLQPQSYKSPTKPIWCPGCGDYAVLNALMRTFADLELPPEEIVVASGIGCSSRFPAFLKTYGFHGVHGRPLPLATGIKLANPQRTVVAVGGDGDGFSIGGGHISHAARRNVDITYIVMDNNIYGMTKGQPSPTTPSGVQRKASPYGTQEDPLNPLMLLLACNASFVARAFSGEIKQMIEIFKAAIQHKGFSFVQVLSPCVTLYNTYEHYKEITRPLPEDHDPTDLMAAIRLAFEVESQYLGIFYRDPHRPTYTQRMQTTRDSAAPTTIEEVMKHYVR
ncbi:MAG: 2-oxoacid:ferredoxin oxidoreductase subunit beta [Anaerolineae bacterium]|nr:2-oxoacid:ferredoxin oxidoreductase subunit beta [Anaerolineae bacterium]